eukprot:m.340586 g.340586  ORF g.340586 m.340586 type:complete len:300 (-) comp19399_c0_seq1:29-928(-)
MADVFFKTEPPPKTLGPQTEQIKDFIQIQKQQGRLIALLTSGGTIIPLERNTVRFLDNFSTGSRGSATAEYLLATGYAVIFVYREGSMRPFHRHHKSVLDMVENNDDLQFKPEIRSTLTSTFIAMQEAQGRLLEIPFVTLTDYLFLLRDSCSLVQECGRHAMVILAAAVSDYYIPYTDMEEHKIQSSKTGSLTVEFKQTPKMISQVRHDWCPDAFIVSFKLETDNDLLLSKAKRSLEMYGHELVIANMLHTRKHQVQLVTREGVENVKLTDREIQDGKEIETHMVAYLHNAHKAFNKSS